MSQADLTTALTMIEWFNKIRECFADLKPEVKTMTINYSRKTSQIRFQIVAPNDWKRKLKKIKIPAFPGYRLIGMTDEGFTEQKNLWRGEDGYFVLDAKNLPASERYLIDMEGAVDENALKKLVYIKPAANRDNDEKNDKYWLESSIKQPNILEKIYEDLEIDEINFGVKIDIEKMFGLVIPDEVKNKIEAEKKLLEVASVNFDRTQLLRAAINYKKLDRIYPSFDSGNFFKLIQKMTGAELIKKYINIDQSYDLGDINRPEKFSGIVPQNIKVHAITRLTLRTPIANGYLEFQREKYIEKLRSEFEKL